MPSGTVKWFNAARGFGFIVPDGGGGDVYVHISVVRKSSFNGLEAEGDLRHRPEEGQGER